MTGLPDQPYELRARILRHTLVCSTVRDCPLHAVVLLRVPTNLLLAAKHVKRECEEYAAKATKVVLKDHVNFAFQRLFLAPPLLNVRRYELQLIFYCNREQSERPHVCDAFTELASHLEWIKGFLDELPNLQTMAIHGYLCYYKQNSESSSELPCSGLVLPAFQRFRDLPKVDHLILGRLEYDAENIKHEKSIDWEWTLAQA